MILVHPALHQYFVFIWCVNCWKWSMMLSRKNWREDVPMERRRTKFVSQYQTELRLILHNPPKMVTWVSNINNTDFVPIICVIQLLHAPLILTKGVTINCCKKGTMTHLHICLRSLEANSVHSTSSSSIQIPNMNTTTRFNLPSVRLLQGEFLHTLTFTHTILAYYHIESISNYE